MANDQREEAHAHQQDGDCDSDAAVVQLGFSVKIESAEHLEAIAHRSPIYNQWAGGEIGGLPAWLQPADIPVGPLHCLNCSSIMRFLCQLYAPVEAESFCEEHVNEADATDITNATATAIATTLHQGQDDRD
jgi:hypothetical protein